MADAPDQDQKTEAPTEKKKADARKDGDVPKSRELLTAAVMLIGCAYLVFTGGMLFSGMSDVLVTGLTFDRGDLATFDVLGRTLRLLGAVALPLAGLLFATIIGAVLAQAMLGGLQFNMKAAKPKASKINPVAGMKRMFSANSLIELGKSVLKVALIGACGFVVLWQGRDLLLGLGYASVTGAIDKVGSTLALLMFTLVGSLVVVALVDVPVQLIQRTKKLRMTKQEVKDEHKQSEGSPEVRAAIRQRQREAIKRDVRQGVDMANVVLTNPTHFAVALSYDQKKGGAPVVVAAGKDEVAAVIRELAAELGKPVLSYPQLARAIYFTSKVGEEIKSELFVAVATVLAFIFDLDRDLSRAKPTVTVPPAMRFDERGDRPKAAQP